MMVAWTKVETVQLMRSGRILNGLMVNNKKKALWCERQKEAMDEIMSK